MYPNVPPLVLPFHVSDISLLFAMREAQRTYRFHFFIAETVVRTKEKRAEQALLEQYTQTLEKIVRQYPEQWFNYYPFWT